MSRQTTLALSVLVVLTILAFSFATLSGLVYGDPEPASLQVIHLRGSHEGGIDAFGNCACSIRELETVSKSWGDPLSL